jgi:hypothetical protein
MTVRGLTPVITTLAAAQQAALVDHDRAAAFAAIADEVFSAAYRKERARKA